MTGRSDVGTKAPHSGPGLASMMAAVLITVIQVSGWGAIYVTYLLSPPQDTESLLLGCFVPLLGVLGMLVPVVGIGLGLAGFLQLDRRKIYCTLGICVNGLNLGATVGYFLWATLSG